eukprot:scaffold30524_cov40-Tisochrysis_lutea.AAC.1
MVSLARLIRDGKLKGVRKLVSYTDSGSDNNSWVTFALCAILIKEGILDQMDWVRVMPGHSHKVAFR